MKGSILALCFLVAAASTAPPLDAAAQSLPARLFPELPFPRVLVQAPTIENVAPGIEYGDYQLLTTIGPLSVHVVAVDPHNADVRVGEILAHDALTSRGETVGSMADRTGAVAGINGDYFDIGNSNRPTNIVVRNGTLLHAPRKRYAIAIERDGSATIAEFSFTGQVQIGERTISLDAVDELPAPDGGTALLTPAFGSVPPEENTTLVSLELLDGTPPLARYRATGIVDNLSRQPPGYYLAIGPAAYGDVELPNDGDVIEASGDLSPVGLDQIVAAMGGGPLILHDGDWYEDPDGPSGGEYAKRIPCSGVAIGADGTLYLIEVDGRHPLVSVGIDRHEFSALMRAFGGVEGMALDGGGSSTIVVRRVGDAGASVANDPSDGVERPVANGLFVYSTAPFGPPARLVARPQIVRAVTGAQVPLQWSAVDAANHVVSSGAPVNAVVVPSWLGEIRDGRFIATAPGDGRIVLRGSGLHGEVAVEVERTPARITIAPAEPNVDENGTLVLGAHAYDAHGYRLDLPQLLPWSATAGSVDPHGIFHAATQNASVAVNIGGASATTLVTVGTHEVTLPFAEHAHFMTLPRGGEGSLVRDPACETCLRLAFAFSSSEYAAYAVAELPLPPHTIGLSFDVDDDGSAARVRIALRNTINETMLADATVLDQAGWRHVAVRFPPEASAAAKLIAIYVLPPEGMQLSDGEIGLRDVRAIVAGK
ncbi:MAG TPA: phosphodiester glycosidase family protein [Verrucomicrobiae bacterium]|nr:phosphodiester glycosidase family protein [Verrucomicrobiae bacterium]